jgi:hypothetical protein
MEISAPHIPYSRIEAAIRAGHLSFLLAHIDSLSLPDEAEVARLIVEQQPRRLEEASVRWIQRFAREAHGQELDDYLRIWEAFHRFPVAPDLSASELVALCAARGIEP